MLYIFCLCVFLSVTSNLPHFQHLIYFDLQYFCLFGIKVVQHLQLRKGKSKKVLFAIVTNAYIIHAHISTNSLPHLFFHKM